MEKELHELIEEEYGRLMAACDFNDAEKVIAYRLIALWLDAFSWGRRHLDPAKKEVAAQCAGEVVKAVMQLRLGERPRRT